VFHTSQRQNLAITTTQYLTTTLRSKRKHELTFSPNSGKSRQFFKILSLADVHREIV